MMRGVPIGMELSMRLEKSSAFLPTNEATVWNTFEKKDIYKQIWQHPKSKQWLCIDYVIMKTEGSTRMSLLCEGMIVI